MTGNESIQILRGTRSKIAGNTLKLRPGQLLYNNTNNYLTIGDGPEQGEGSSSTVLSTPQKPVCGKPITVPTVEGTYSNIKETDGEFEIGVAPGITGNYHLKPLKGQIIEFYSSNDLSVVAGKKILLKSESNDSNDFLKLFTNNKITTQTPTIELNASTNIKIDTPELILNNCDKLSSTEKIWVETNNTIDIDANELDIDSVGQINLKGSKTILDNDVDITGEVLISKGLKVTDVPSDQTDVIRKKELDEAIAALDSSTTAVTDGYFLTGITLTDGKINNQTSNNNISGNAANASKLNCDITFTPAETALTPENVRTLIGEKSQIRRASWYYAGNGHIEKGTTATSQCPFGAIDLAGTTVIQANTNQGFTQVYITPPTASTANAITGEMLYYIDNGNEYNPTWYRVLTNANCNSILDDRYVNVTGDTMTGKLTIDLGNSGLDTKVSDWALETDGNIRANIYSAVSDRRLKKNIIPYKNDKSILDLPIYEFDYIKNNNHTIGCLAQDLQEICPELVDEDENGYLSIQESKLIYLLINEIKELKKEIKGNNK